MINLYNIDCMEFMKDIPDKYYELAIVDPPYGLGEIDHKLHKKFKWNNNIPFDNYFCELYRISKNQIIWGCNYYFKNIISPGRIIHYKHIDPRTNMSQCDLASHSFSNKIDYFNYGWSGNVQGSKINWKNEGIDRRIHPTQKPVQLYKWLLKNYAKKGNKIFDSHLGSGSIAIACHDLGFDLDACEIDKEYYDAAVKRFEIHKSQLKLF